MSNERKTFLNDDGKFVCYHSDGVVQIRSSIHLTGVTCVNIVCGDCEHNGSSSRCNGKNIKAIQERLTKYLENSKKMNDQP